MTPTPPNFRRHPDPDHSVETPRPAETPCPTCNGGSDEYYNTPGRERDAPCPTCRGHGVVYTHRPLPKVELWYGAGDPPDPPPAGPRRPWWVRLLRLVARLIGRR